MVLMPSRYHEFSPYSALEAAAAGVPVVATPMGGLPELIGAESCVAAEAFPERVATLWADPNDRRRAGDALLARVRERHSQERFGTGLLSLYRALLDR
jgi:glycosyltransferase involved in cell wall biosynthesis